MQVEAVSLLYCHDSRHNYHSYMKGDMNNQKHAQAVLEQLGLDTASHSALEIPFDFTGCIAHVKVTEHCSDGEVTQITGCFSHNPECQSATLKCLLAVPLHDHVYQVVLEQLEGGASITAIQAHNHEMIEKKQYHGMWDWDPKTANVQYHLLPTDNMTLYCKFSCQLGVDPRKEPQYNIDDWLNPTLPDYCPEIADAIFHYMAQSEAGDCFKVCISTSEMKEAAWKYAHHSQLILDGTFGICTSCLLLFIALAHDEHGKGVPIAFFLFSAPTGNQATHASYNMVILEELISKWKSYLGKHPPTLEPFTPYVTITDTDTKERSALLRVWHSICLLLCKFHLWQCWTNHRKSVLRGKCNEYWKDRVMNALPNLEVQLISTSDHPSALALVSQQHAIFIQMSEDPKADSCLPAKGSIKHLDYLLVQWMPSELWQSWSEWGHIKASALLQIPIKGVILTTNQC
ncbi:hypothetical protein CPB84DRAFT_1816246 [Gymnopilus junonius]|uniref:MULE transposase domain-containing protein n=1 Tax=Gymnopilus junonius TaxID=109634 RepID=A0A9P5NJ72_GYMJU|nr:hypothetical protein CPB84DRAFT_1816246 [Gymnopilus junonius]